MIRTIGYYHLLGAEHLVHAPQTQLLYGLLYSTIIVSAGFKTIREPNRSFRLLQQATMKAHFIYINITVLSYIPTWYTGKVSRVKMIFKRVAKVRLDVHILYWQFNI